MSVSINGTTGTTVDTLVLTTNTGSTAIPSGSTTQRPVYLAVGMIRYNNIYNTIEYCDGTSWRFMNDASYAATYLMIAGGGGGGRPFGGFDLASGGGGGAGGLLTGTYMVLPGVTYSFIIGSGGSGTTPANGENTSGFGLTLIGGGRGGNGDSSSGTAGFSGGSGGGGGYANKPGGTATVGQGNVGGASTLNTGGGGGAGAVGGTPNGGVGISSSITGAAVTYAGGGGGGGSTITGRATGTGGTGGGGAGGTDAAGTSGTANTGGGGGGVGGSNGALLAGSGGSGVVILSVPTSVYSGITTGSPTITTSGANTIIKFTANGSYTA